MRQNIPLRNLDTNSGSSRFMDKIHTRSFKGYFRRLRVLGGVFLFTLYFGTVWLQWGDRQAVFWDLSGKQFHVFGSTFWPKDLVLLSAILIICAFGLFFLTVLAGRVWCGYTCPQTVWTFIFMWVEERIEGSRNKRMKLDKAPSSANKVAKKSAKHTVWFLIALATGLTFVGYFYPIRELIADLFTLQANGWAYFWVGFFTVATYLNAGWMREQVCLYMCPYARFQSVMFDPDTRIVSYDPNRGEPRGGRKKGADPAELGLGDCIDCGQCVQVCPTGIDIRDGLQYECIGCALCIDACDEVMDKMEYPRGLIRYTTENELEGKPSKLMRPRTFGYGLALVLMILAMGYTIATRVPATLDVERDRGALFKFNGQGRVENSYTLRIANMTEVPQTFSISVSGMETAQILTDTVVTVGNSANLALPTVVDVDPDVISSASNTIIFKLISETDPSLVLETESRFVGPNR